MCARLAADWAASSSSSSSSSAEVQRDAKAGSIPIIYTGSKATEEASKKML